MEGDDPFPAGTVAFQVGQAQVQRKGQALVAGFPQPGWHMRRAAPVAHCPAAGFQVGTGLRQASGPKQIAGGVLPGHQQRSGGAPGLLRQRDP
ncbi:hypothetical protein ACFOGJ_00285 [Marinibaculum pumilum]|uniref:Uncharacterized protein n=1 Tax=Marinibaculum pumilum TaxID=1766165 RepID=A0ABV7KTD6_9PROT